MSAKIASWNVNSIKARKDIVLKWLTENPVDMLCIQELKCEESAFPFDDFKAIGYHAYVSGQKTYNGVATLIKDSETSFQIPDFHEEARIIINNYRNIDVINVYCPNGNPVGTDKFEKKKIWMKSLIQILESNIKNNRNTICLGDFNIIPTDMDAATPSEWVNDALHLSESIDYFRTIENIGYTDAFRALNKNVEGYTFWDYQAGAWQRNNGIRIDHIMLSPKITDKLISCEIDKAPRGWEKPSDHTPIIAELDIED